MGERWWAGKRKGEKKAGSGGGGAKRVAKKRGNSRGKEYRKKMRSALQVLVSPLFCILRMLRGQDLFLECISCNILEREGLQLTCWCVIEIVVSVRSWYLELLEMGICVNAFSLSNPFSLTILPLLFWTGVWNLLLHLNCQPLYFSFGIFSWRYTLMILSRVNGFENPPFLMDVTLDFGLCFLRLTSREVSGAL